MSATDNIVSNPRIPPSCPLTTARKGGRRYADPGASPIRCPATFSRKIIYKYKTSEKKRQALKRFMTMPDASSLRALCTGRHHSMTCHPQSVLSMPQAGVVAVAMVVSGSSRYNACQRPKCRSWRRQFYLSLFSFAHWPAHTEPAQSCGAD